MPKTLGTDFVQSLERGLEVIRAFDAESPVLTLSDVARRTGLSRAAARRFLLTLAELGYVRTDGRLFSLRPKVLELGYAYLSSLSLPEIALPHMERLVAEIRESSSASVLDGDQVIYVARVPTRRIMSINISVGTHFPAVATSMGRVLLANLPAADLDLLLENTRLTSYTAKTLVDVSELRKTLDLVRRQGWATVDEELEEGLRSLAVPIRYPDGSIRAAVNVSVPVSGYPMGDLQERLLPPLLQCADHISADLVTAPPLRQATSVAGVTTNSEPS